MESDVVNQKSVAEEEGEVNIGELEPKLKEPETIEKKDSSAV